MFGFMFVNYSLRKHLETIDYLRRGIGLRGYGQRDPLVEYKKESFHLYKELLGLINKNVT